MNWLDLILIIAAVVVLVRSWDADAVGAAINLFCGVVAAPLAGKIYTWPALGLFQFIPERWAGLLGFLATYAAVISVLALVLNRLARPVKHGAVHGAIPAVLHLMLLGVVVSVGALTLGTFPAINLIEPLQDSRITLLALRAFGFLRPLLPVIFQVGEMALKLR